ncbi:hypothetical protein Mp_3g01560 [Marchantia polymorpha subsp. ruderalis]|uniref:Uncharacterized protein n=2 Tax=Marchantia polymorpha TaxID=3197 RepID=A0AAF6AWC8_MARPO|nr:hypothetical protein MARPO_0007s0148 [Marchantia polymorpha]BBN04062.1 hypothetical protein Mp_3g01560 [Marchantia polymorpha subsp. ruderalis]|eukprot:PTQ47749.1 hypothetical protein MARPO_0007s0148 [Marchantia polymorpha]
MRPRGHARSRSPHIYSSFHVISCHAMSSPGLAPPRADGPERRGPIEAGDRIASVRWPARDLAAPNSPAENIRNFEPQRKATARLPRRADPREYTSIDLPTRPALGNARDSGMVLVADGWGLSAGPTSAVAARQRNEPTRLGTARRGREARGREGKKGAAEDVEIGIDSPRPKPSRIEAPADEARHEGRGPRILEARRGTKESKKARRGARARRKRRKSYGGDKVLDGMEGEGDGAKRGECGTESGGGGDGRGGRGRKGFERGGQIINAAQQHANEKERRKQGARGAGGTRSKGVEEKGKRERRWVRGGREGGGGNEASDCFIRQVPSRLLAMARGVAFFRC